MSYYLRKYLQGLTYSSLIGIGEIVLLPLDVLKIKRQTNPEAFRGRGVLRIVRDEGFGLYRGWGWTAARNAPGSFAVSTLNSQIVLITNKRGALWWICIYEGIFLWTLGLQQGHMVPEFHSLNRWCISFLAGICTS